MSRFFQEIELVAQSGLTENSLGSAKTFPSKSFTLRGAQLSDFAIKISSLHHQDMSLSLTLQ